MTRCVAEAWEVFCRERREVIIRSFRCIGGSSNSEMVSILKELTPRLMAALKDWKTRGAPVENESDDDSATVSDSNESDSGPDGDVFEPL